MKKYNSVEAQGGKCPTPAAPMVSSHETIKIELCIIHMVHTLLLKDFSLTRSRVHPHYNIFITYVIRFFSCINNIHKIYWKIESARVIPAPSLNTTLLRPQLWKANNI